MANLRIRPNGVIQYDVCIYGVRFRETSGLKATPKNIKIVGVLPKDGRIINSFYDISVTTND